MKLMRGMVFWSPAELAKMLNQGNGCFVFEDGAQLMVVSDETACRSLGSASVHAIPGMNVFPVIRMDVGRNCGKCKICSAFRGATVVQPESLAA